MEQDVTKDKLTYGDDGKPVLPSSLNVITILTFIGCGIGLLFTILTPMLMKFAQKAIDSTSGQDLSPKKMQEIEDARKGIELYSQNQIPLIIVGLVGIALCIWGAIEMRKLKKQGYIIYLFGELAPILAGGLIMGFSVQFNSIWSTVIGLAFPVLFVILYTVNRKHLVN